MRDDIFLFGEVVCSELTSDSTECVLHRDIARFHHDKPKLGAIVSPRGHGKTTWASTIATVHDVAYDRETVIIIIKKTFQQAVTDLQNIVNFIKYSPKFKLFFGRSSFEFLIDRQERVYIRNRITGHKTWIEAKGAGQSIRGIVVEGNRPSKFLLDDFEDENNTATDEQRNKVREWMAAQVMPSLDPHSGHILAIGTIVHYDSWLNNRWEGCQAARADGKEYSWKMIFHQMIEDGKPIWPERFTPEYIDQLRFSYEELGRIDMFYQEYMNVPFNPEDADFKREYITYYKGMLIYDPKLGHILEIGEKRILVDVVVGVDPSSGTSGDYTGIAIVATDTENNRYLIQADRFMLKPDELKERIFEIYDRYKPRLIVIEEVAMQVIMTYWLRSEMRRRNKFLPLRGEKVSTRQTKEDKLRNALQPIYASGVMHHLRGQIALEEELFTFPKGKHDDILDALYLACKYARKSYRNLEDVMRKASKKTREIVDWMTGATVERTL